MANRHLLAPCAALATAFALVSGPVHASVLASYNDFSSTAGLTLVGKTAATTTTDGSVLRIVPATSYSSGAAYSTTPVTLGGSATFSTQFQFRITQPGGSNPADGITFVLAAGSSGLGGNGQGLGYANVAHSVAVEFDTYNNGASDGNSSNHVGVDVNGSTNSIVLANPYGVTTCNFTRATYYTTPGCMSDGDKWTVTITYDGTTLNVTVQDGTMAAVSVINTAINISSYLGTNTAYVGFTGSTGGGYENEDILNWTFANTSVLPVVSVPEPGTVALVCGGVLGMVALRRRKRTA